MTHTKRCCDSDSAARRIWSRLKPGQDGAGTGMVFGLVASGILLLTMVLAVVTASSAQSKAATAADMAALAAADVARGLKSGEPCNTAQLLAAEHGAELSSCQIDSTHAVTVSVTTRVPTVFVLEWLQAFDLAGVGKARAGPPPLNQN